MVSPSESMAANSVLVVDPLLRVRRRMMTAFTSVMSTAPSLLSTECQSRRRSMYQGRSAWPSQSASIGGRPRLACDAGSIGA